MEEINVGEFSEALNDKMDRDGNNIESPRLPIFLVAKQDPTAENNYTWYRKWSDGWVEQGGYISANNVREISSAVTLPVPILQQNSLLILMD